MPNHPNNGIGRRGFLALPLAAFAPALAQSISRIGPASNPLDQIAPGSLVMIEGGDLRRDGLISTTSFPRPQSFEDIRVQVNGIDAPIFYADQDHVLLQIPFEAALGRATITLVTPNKSVSLERDLVPSAPSLFLQQDGSPLAVRFSDGAILGPHNPPIIDEWWTLYTTGLPRDWFPIPTGQPTPVKADGEPYITDAALMIGGERAYAGGAVWVPGTTAIQNITFRVDGPRGVHAVRVTAAAGSSVAAYLPMRADNEPLLEGIVTATDVVAKPRAYTITITGNSGAKQETAAPAGRYLTYFPGKPASGSVIDPLHVRVSSGECYPLERTHAIGQVLDTTLSHIMIPRLTDPRETLRLNPNATNQDFVRGTTGTMFIVDPTAALDAREYLYAGWMKGLVEMFDPEYATRERLELRPVSMYNGRWMQQLPFKVFLNPNGTAADTTEFISKDIPSYSLVPSAAAVDAAAEYMLSWNKAFPQPVIQLVDYDPTKREGEQGTFVLWGLTGNGADFRIRASDRSQQSIVYLNWSPEHRPQSIGEAASHELGHLIFGLAHRLQRGIMKGVGSAMTVDPDPIEQLAARTNFSFPGQFDYLGDRLAKVGYDPVGALGYDQPYFHGKHTKDKPFVPGTIPEIINRPSWYKA